MFGPNVEFHRCNFRIFISGIGITGVGQIEISFDGSGSQVWRVCMQVAILAGYISELY